MRKSLFYVSCTVMFVLFCAIAAFSGESTAVKGDIPQKELAAYHEVAQILADNPSLSKEEIDSLLTKNELTRERYEAIDRQVQSNSELQKKVEEGDTPKTTALEELEKIPGVRTKLKKPAAPEVK